MKGRTRVQGRGIGTSSRGGMRARTERDGSGADLTGRRGGTVRELAVKVKTVASAQGPLPVTIPLRVTAFGSLHAVCCPRIMCIDTGLL